MNKLIALAIAGTMAVPAFSAQAPQDISAIPYFGNSVVLRNDAGAIFEILYFKPDRTYRVWNNGVWHDATWLTNNGQDSKIMCLTHGTPVKTYCHPMVLSNKVGDRWKAGQPLRLNGKWAIADAPETVAASGSLFTTGLEKGLVSPPTTVLPPGPPPPSVDLGPTRNKIVEPYFGNSVVVRDKSGATVEINYYASDQTLRQWRAGAWTDGQWVPSHWRDLAWLTNNGHDSTLLCLTYAQDGTPVSNCYYVPEPKKLGDRWDLPAFRDGDSSGLTASLEKGLVKPPSGQ